jgi:hypothetical protein
VRAIPLSSSILTFWEDIVFLESALLADGTTQALAAPVTALLEGFPAVLKADLDTRRGLLQSHARVGVADDLLDAGIRKVFSAALHLVAQDRERTEFVTLFPTHIGDVIRHALKRQIEVAQLIVARLALPMYPEGFREEQKSILLPLIEAARAVLAEQHESEGARIRGRAVLRTFKEDVNAVRLSVEGHLTTLGSHSRLGKPWVDGFFLQRPAQPSPDEPESETDAREVHAEHLPPVAKNV